MLGFHIVSNTLTLYCDHFDCGSDYSYKRQLLKWQPLILTYYTTTVNVQHNRELSIEDDDDVC